MEVFSRKISPEVYQRIKSNLERVRERIARACQSAGRSPDEITLIAVSKKKSPEEIAAAFELGQRDFGENYVQEWREKRETLSSLEKDGLRWHFIGRLQRNKCKYLAGKVELIHSIDSKQLLDELEKRVPPESVQKFLLQFNLSGEQTKGGFRELADISPLLKDYLADHWPKLELVGLMTMPPADALGDRALPYFERLAEIKERLEKQHQLKLPVLSMGMSSDLEAAIRAGSTCVRVGTAIFGPRL